MNKLFLCVATFGLLALAGAAQDTNSLNTKLGSFEAQTDVILVKSYAPVGSITVGTVEVSVRYKQTVEVGSGHKRYGLGIEIERNSFPRERLLVDDDEIDPLLNALNYLIKINYEVTTLPGFEASFTTKSSLRVIADSVRRDGVVLTYLQSGDTPRIQISSVQMTQFYNLITQAQKSLNALKSEP